MGKLIKRYLEKKAQQREEEIQAIMNNWEGLE